ncbi:10148_t:CDS:2 [Ambispora gerdemannii]|uniref:10148_t:CDS:1 n=1 Tax=Ambispora gerdemannii TaxID=144530 RepID=A0A9N9GZP3_9GLOM|nr:10148_t:CDS:2 [Ambispora gerdemannii]
MTKPKKYSYKDYAPDEEFEPEIPLGPSVRVGTKFKLPTIGASATPVIGNLFKIGSHAIDRLKDAHIDAQFSAIATELGDLKDGIDGVNVKVEAQGKALKGAMDGMKTELEGHLKQQGQKFDKEIKNLDAKIATAQGENLRKFEEQKKAMAAQKQELESQIQEVTQNLNRVESQLTNALNDFKSEVNERFEAQEQKILANKRKIEELIYKMPKIWGE